MKKQALRSFQFLLLIGICLGISLGLMVSNMVVGIAIGLCLSFWMGIVYSRILNYKRWMLKI